MSGEKTETNEMTAISETSGQFTYANWEEKQADSDESYPRIAQARVTNHFSGGIEAPDTVCVYAIAYTGEATGSCTGMQLFTGRLDGREGGFVVEENATFGADGAVHCTFTVVPDTATGELKGLTGRGSYVARVGEKSFDYTFRYRLG